MPAEESPQPRVAEGIPEIGEIDVLFSISLPRPGEDGIGARLDSAVDKAGEVNAEKRDCLLYTSQIHDALGLVFSVNLANFLEPAISASR